MPKRAVYEIVRQLVCLEKKIYPDFMVTLNSKTLKERKNAKLSKKRRCNFV